MKKKKILQNKTTNTHHYDTTTNEETVSAWLQLIETFSHCPLPSVSVASCAAYRTGSLYKISQAVERVGCSLIGLSKTRKRRRRSAILDSTPNVHLSNKCTHSTRKLEYRKPSWRMRVKKGVGKRPNMAPKFKKAKKTRELADRYTVVLAQRSTYTGNYKALQPTRTMKRLTNTVWAVKTWSCYLNSSGWWSAVVIQARARWQQ